MKSKQSRLVASADIAAQMAAGWSDDHLNSKTPRDLVVAYGCSDEAAKYILDNELTKRRLARIKDSRGV